MTALNRLFRHALVVPAILLPGLVWRVFALAPPRFRPKSIFLLYPGRAAELPGYCPAPLLPLTRTRLFWSRPVPLGTMFLGWRPVGIVMGVPNDQKRLLGGKDDLDLILARLLAAGRKIGARRISLAGQMPSMIVRHGLSRDPSIVEGIMGTVFVVADCLRQVLERHHLGQGARVAVFGAGLIGGVLIGHLRAQGIDVAGIDQAPRGAEIHPVAEAGPVLAKTDVVVLLSARGSDFVPHLSSLKKGSVILDDTHPSFPQARLALAEGEGAGPYIYYRALATHPDLRTIPSLPGYEPDWIPGCALEGVVMAETDPETLEAQGDFDAAATRLGFRGLLAGWQT
jgi:hypothetical protein